MVITTKFARFFYVPIRKAKYKMLIMVNIEFSEATRLTWLYATNTLKHPTVMHRTAALKPDTRFSLA